MSRAPLKANPPAPDREAEKVARAHQRELSKPPGSLAGLEDLAVALAAMQGQARPSARPAEALIFAADHPVVAHGVSMSSSEATAQMVASFLGGGAAASVLCRRLGIPLTVVDVGLAHPVQVRAPVASAPCSSGAPTTSGASLSSDAPRSPSSSTSWSPSTAAPEARLAREESGPTRARREQAEHVAYREQLERAGVQLFRDPVADEPEGDLREARAMSLRTFERAVAAGVAAVDRLPEDTRLLILGEIGIGNSTCAAAVAASLLDCDGAELAGPGAGFTDESLARKRAVVRDAARLARGKSPAQILAAVGGRELAAIAGAVGRAAERRICVLVDGFIVATAVLAAVRAASAIRPYLLFSHASTEPGHRMVLKAMQARPLLDLGLHLGEASGALTAFPLLELACALHNEMSTLTTANVTAAAGASP